jgi:hypothetical protein
VSDELGSVLRNQAFEDIGRVAVLVESYARSIGEAAYRGDQTTVEVHLRQLRSCCIAMIKTYKDYLEAAPNGQDVAAKGGSQSDRQDQRSGDGVA